MAFLYVDSCDRLKLGLLDQKLEWIEYLDIGDKKSSGIIHGILERLLDKYGYPIEELQGLIYGAGPGSYTGMRVAEGMAQIFEWQGIPVYSFYHFEVPKMLGISSGTWVADAFKNEIFSYYWDESSEKSALIKSDQFTPAENLFSNAPEKISVDGVQDIFKLIHKDGQKLFSKVVEEKIRRKPYYFRAIDQDFKKPS